MFAGVVLCRQVISRSTDRFGDSFTAERASKDIESCSNTYLVRTRHNWRKHAQLGWRCFSPQAWVHACRTLMCQLLICAFSTVRRQENLVNCPSQLLKGKTLIEWQGSGRVQLQKSNRLKFGFFSSCMYIKRGVTSQSVQILRILASSQHVAHSISNIVSYIAEFRGVLVMQHIFLTTQVAQCSNCTISDSLSFRLLCIG